jgi:plastocyanin
MPRTRTIRLLATVASLTLVTALAASCDDDDNDVVDDVRDDAEEVVDDIRDIVTGEMTVTITDLSYPDITVDADTTVVFVNSMGVPHTVTSGTPGDPTGVFSEDLDPGGSADITFDETGTFEFFCEIHNQMQGSATVE